MKQDDIAKSKLIPPRQKPSNFTRPSDCIWYIDSLEDPSSAVAVALLSNVACGAVTHRWLPILGDVLVRQGQHFVDSEDERLIA